MVSEEKLKQLLFPYKQVRKIQSELIQQIDFCLENKKNLIVHAPTGLGKTAAVLPAALSYAIKKNLTVFFLTSRHTQHLIVLETLKEIKNRYNIEIISVDIIGKKHMCPVPGTDQLYSNEFFDYCKSQRQENKCEFYTNTRKKSGKPELKAKLFLKKIKSLSPYHCEDLMKLCSEEKLCSYEISILLASEAKVIIADYYYIFNPIIRDALFNKAKKELQNTIIIIDEGHNLPKRSRELLTEKLSTITISRAIKEAEKYRYPEVKEQLEAIKQILEHMTDDVDFKKQEKLIKKQEFIEKINLIENYDVLISNLTLIGDDIKEKQKKSSVSSIANFLQAWLGQDKSFVRIIEKKQGTKKPVITISYRCLDPSILTKDIVNNSYSTIIMSGTLTPTSMYQDMLGFDKNKTIEKEYSSPFPDKNRLNLIVPETTTKFTKRNHEEYKKIAHHLAEITNLIPGNSAVFFPSYRLRDDVYVFFQFLCKKTIFLEDPRLTKIEKQELLDKFKSYKEAVLLGVASGSFGEGIDLPGILKSVIVVGLPLQKPNLETASLIDYYEEKFSKGWDYAYVFPAITKCLQSAGRCIRSEKDRGIIIFLDERFAWNNYRKCFPSHLNIEVTRLYKNKISNFF